jgi:hypothetical protein
MVECCAAHHPLIGNIEHNKILDKSVVPGDRNRSCFHNMLRISQAMDHVQHNIPVSPLWICNVLYIFCEVIHTGI